MDERTRREGILAGQLAALGGAFRTRLAADRGALRDLCAALENADAEATPEVAKRIERAAHRLHGTAAMFGYAELGDCAGRLELAARDAVARNSSPEALRAAVMPPATALDQALEAALRTPPPSVQSK